MSHQPASAALVKFHLKRYTSSLEAELFMVSKNNAKSLKS